MTYDVADQGGDDDDGAAHGWGAALGGVCGRAFLADQLAIAAAAEDPDRQWRAEQGQDQRHPCRHDNRPHRATSAAASASATVCRPAARDALTKTTSPGRSRSPSAASAAAPSGTPISSPVKSVMALAPISLGAATTPTAISPASPLRAAAMPACSWNSLDRSPSSAIRPSTAYARRPSAITRRAARAAVTASGLAL